MTPHVHGLNPTKDLPVPTVYVQALMEEYRDWAFCEERAPEYKGRWRSRAFDVSDLTPLDLEIGTGNGFHFAHYASENPDRCFVGLEIKYRPLSQSIRRARKLECTNMRMARYDGGRIGQLFSPGELNQVFIHHPDPWPKKRQWGRRLIQDDFLVQLHGLQKRGGRVDFKTDDLNYFEWALEKFKNSPYGEMVHTYDLHHSKFAEENFITHFESIFLKKGQPIYFLRAYK